MWLQHELEVGVWEDAFKACQKLMSVMYSTMVLLFLMQENLESFCVLKVHKRRKFFPVVVMNLLLLQLKNGVSCALKK
jgi:hypothetical protein